MATVLVNHLRSSVTTWLCLQFNPSNFQYIIQSSIQLDTFTCKFQGFEPPHDKTNKLIFASSEDSDRPGHLPSLIRVFAVRMNKPLSLATHWAHSEDSSEWTDAQADLSIHWAHRSFCWFCHEAARLNWVSWVASFACVFQTLSDLGLNEIYMWFSFPYLPYIFHPTLIPTNRHFFRFWHRFLCKMF